MIPANPQEYEHKNCVVVPLAFFDKLMRCYYGQGPRDGEDVYHFAPENASSEIMSDISKLKDTTIRTDMPPGIKPRGIAEKKIKAKERGTRHAKTTEEQNRPSKDN